MSFSAKSKIVARLEDESDPFMQGATRNDSDNEDPFDLESDKSFVKRNVVPMDVLQKVFCWCEPKTLLVITQVNRNWHEVSDSDKVWKRLCKDKWGPDITKEHKSYCQNLGWKLAYFVGICKTVLVNTPTGAAIALTPYSGLTVRDLLTCLNIDKVHHYSVSSQNFSDAMATECDDMEADGEEGCWLSLAKACLCDILIEPFSTINVESIRRKDQSVKRRSSVDDDGESQEKMDANKALEEQCKLAWRSKALAKLEKLPKFIKRDMRFHWASLYTEPRRNSGPSILAPSTSASKTAAPSAKAVAPSAKPAVRGTTPLTTTKPSTPASSSKPGAPVGSKQPTGSVSSADASKRGATVSYASGRPPSAKSSSASSSTSSSSLKK